MVCVCLFFSSSDFSRFSLLFSLFRQCACSRTFCATHRHAEEHACTFDFKTSQRDQLAKQNPVVVADKVAPLFFMSQSFADATFPLPQLDKI